MRCTLAGRLAFCLVVPLILGALAASATSATPTGRDNDGLVLNDSVYAANHPKLLYTQSDIPALYNKVRDGGNDDLAYSFIRIVIQYIYPGSTTEELLDDNYGISTFPNLGMGSALESPPDPAPYLLGHDLTVYIADTWGPDFDNFNSALRLRSLVLGYDMFFGDAEESERTYIRDEIESYIDLFSTDDDYDIWSYRPYLSNVSVMIASSLGLAAICLDGEIEPYKIEYAIDRADYLIHTWLKYHVDEEGAYNEGALYGAWSMRNLIYYFWARLRYDGYDFSQDGKIRNMEKWFAFELHPDGGAMTNNIQDSEYLEHPLSQHTTYFDWAQTAWGSGLSAYIWDHVAGIYGHNSGTEADKAGTVLWNQNLTPIQPETVLPASVVWEHRGLYYYRSGWPVGATSGDVMFSFYSGQFQGGHSQEDQNQFTLYAYGAHFAMDHGSGTLPRESEAHNMVFIDGAGQHFSGASIGTDGRFRTHIVNDFSDYLLGDATSAYTTHSPLNNPSFPFPKTDWSWGYQGANPVDHAYRSVFVVRDPGTPPYFIIIDDIEKDGAPHTYEWRLHTGRDNTIDTTSNPIHIADGNAFLDIHVLNPAFNQLQKSIAHFNNLVPDPDSNILSLRTTAVNPMFAFVLIPGDAGVVPPVVTSTTESWGFSVAVEWPTGDTDHLLVNTSGGIVSHTLPSGASNPAAVWDITDEDIETDAGLALVRFNGGGVEKYSLIDATTFSANGTNYVTIGNGPMTIANSGSAINMDRYEADFSLYAPGVTDVFYRGQRIYVNEVGGYLTRDTAASVDDPVVPAHTINVASYPNPFNPSTTIAVEIPAPSNVEAAIFDTSGRLVKRLWNGPLSSGVRTFHWNGESSTGDRVASGVYFVKVTAGSASRTVKITVLK